MTPPGAPESRLRTYGVWLALGAVVLVVVVVASWPRGGADSVEARTRRISEELRCVDCEGLSVWDSATDSAKATRRDVAARIRAGQSDGDIRRVYVDRYGESVLLKPSSDGVGVLVWALPIVVLIVAAGGLALALRRWQRQPRLEATAADEQVVARARAAEHPGADRANGAPPGDVEDGS
jgi:cytochrome c-type biogenesis protein CcmH